MARTFHWSIARRLFRKQPLGSLRLMVISAISVMLAFGALWYYERSWTSLREMEQEVVISIVLSAPDDSNAAYRAASDLRSVPNVAEGSVLTPEMWQREFVQRYQVEISDVVPENPFTYSIRVRLLQGAISAESFMEVYSKCRSLPLQFDEITYPSDVLRTVLETQASIIGRVTGVCVLVGLAIVLLLTSAFRATNPLSGDDVHLLTMMGASTLFTLRSMLWRNIATTIPGIAVAAGILLSVPKEIQSLWPLHGNPPMQILVAGSAGSVLVLSLIISRFAASRS